jgi:hypothetical protein
VLGDVVVVGIVLPGCDVAIALARTLYGDVAIYVLTSSELVRVACLIDQVQCFTEHMSVCMCTNKQICVIRMNMSTCVIAMVVAFPLY